MPDPKQGRGKRSTLTPPEPRRAGTKPSSEPEIDVGEAPLGRKTLVEMQDDMRASPTPRAPLLTISYDDLPLDSKVAKPPRVPNVALKAATADQTPLPVVPPTMKTTPPLSKHHDDGPEIEYREMRRPEIRGAAPDLSPSIEVGQSASIGRETMALIELDTRQRHSSLPPPPSQSRPPSSAPGSQRHLAEVLELRTFVVPVAVLGPKATEQEKRDFVAGRVAHKLPCPINQVRRIDAKLFEPGATLIRVWCEVD